MGLPTPCIPGLTVEIISDDPYVQEHYEKCLAEGTSDSLARMFAFAQPPMSNSDREFLEGHCNGNQFAGQEHIGNFYKRQARRAGVDPKGKVYLSGLAEFPGDPRAWVADRADAKKVVEERGWNCEGAITVRSERTGGTPPVDVAEDLVTSAVQEAVDADPGLAEKPTAEVREKVKKKIKPHWTK